MSSENVCPHHHHHPGDFGETQFNKHQLLFIAEVVWKQTVKIRVVCLRFKNIPSIAYRWGG